MARRGKSEPFEAVFWMVAILWIVFLLDTQLSLGLARFGIFPRDWIGLLGVVCWPLLHGSAAHLASNSTSLLLFGMIICARGSRDFLRLTVYITLVAGVGVWLIGRPSLHIGASGLVFGYFGYIVMRSFYDRRFSSALIATVLVLLFGGMIWGVLPSEPRISWEGHLCGLLAGLAGARGQK